VSRKAQLILFVVGAGVFGWLVYQIGVARLWHDAQQTGWMFIPIVALFAIVYWFNAAAWHVMMMDEPSRPPFWQTYAITVSGFSINFLTPMMNMGGEPFKIAAAGAWLGQRRAAGYVILYTLMHGLSILVTGYLSVVLAFIFLPKTLPVFGLLLGLLALTTVLTVLILGCLRKGALEKILDILNRVPLVKLAARRWLEPRRTTLIQLDQQIVELYHQRPKRFYQALALECIGRAVFMVEYVLIAIGVGVSMNYWAAYAIGGVSTLILNALFFVPFEVGTKELTFLLLFQSMGFDPQLGFYTSIVSRVRDFGWIGIGLMLIWLTGRRTMLERTT
jgi:hypothetical protein